MRLKNYAKSLLRKWKLLLFLAIVIGGLFWWWYSSTQAAKPKLTFIKPAHENLVKTLEISGIVNAKEKAQLRFLAGGKIVYLGAQEGDQVKKYQTIATIDRATLQKQLEQDLNNYMKERWDFESDKDTQEEIVPTLENRRDFDQAQWDLENQVLNVEMQDIAIRNTALTAPFNGVLTHSPTSVIGVVLSPTDYFEIINPETLVFVGRVDEADIALVQEGQSTTITLDAYPDSELATYVDYIAFTSSQTTTGTSFDVEFPLAQIGQRELFRLGMNGDANIVLDERKDVMTIPIIATIQRDDKIYVEVRTGEQTAEEREIRVGLETDDKYEVLGGLSPEDEIVLPE